MFSVQNTCGSTSSKYLFMRHICCLDYKYSSSSSGFAGFDYMFVEETTFVITCRALLNSCRANVCIFMFPGETPTFGFVHGSLSLYRHC